MYDYTPKTEEIRQACRRFCTGEQFDRWLNDELSKAWRRGRKDMGYMFGHYHDCAGWEDCYCTKHINPYEDNTEITAFCGQLETHATHTEPQRGEPGELHYTPAFTCGGFYHCMECYEAYYSVPSLPHEHVCEVE